MDKGGASMDASQDGWDWEVLPDRRTVHGHGGMILGDQETKEPNLPPAEDAHVRKTVDECKDIGVVPDETKSTQEELIPNLTELLVSDGEDEHETFQSSDAKEVDDDKVLATEAAPPHQLAEEEEIKKDRARPECVVFSVGKLKVNGIGALCSFGVAAATVCIFLIGGRQQKQKQKRQQIQLQYYGDDKRMKQASRLNQAMSSVMGGGASTRANISFGGFYDGF